MTPQLVDMTQAQKHVRSLFEDQDDLSFKLTAASAIVLNYLKLNGIPESWMANTSPIVYSIPFDVQAATLLVLGELYENRESSSSDPLSPTVMALLERYRDPALS